MPRKESADKIAVTIAELNKKYGDGTIMRLGNDRERYTIRTVSSGILALDRALGGGYPCGRLIEIYGPEMSGKTALATYGLIQIQRQGREVAVIDLENTFNAYMAQANGLDIDNLYIAQPLTGEEAFDIVESLAKTGEFGGIIFDSVAGTTTRQEVEKEIGDQVVASQARLFSQALRRLVGTLAKSECNVFFINQIREKVGVMYGNPEVTPGGRALKFYSSVRIEVRPQAYLSGDGREVKTRSEAAGHRVRARVVKNKVFPPFKEAEFDFYYGRGVDLVSDMFNTAIDLGIISRSGAWFTYVSSSGEEIRCQGARAIAQALSEKSLTDEVKAKVHQGIIAAPAEGSREPSVDRGDRRDNSADGDLIAQDYSIIA